MKKIPLGPFELYRPIGRGGMGEVWEGLHVPQQFPVAVKVVTDKAARRDAYIESFRNEIRSVAALDHPGIIAVLDYGEVPHGSSDISKGALIEGSPYIVMELARRGSLQKYHDMLGWRETKLVLFTILDALAHAHASGLIHRDLKPGNILIGCGEATRAGIKLTDFGLAHTIEAVGKDERTGWGTPQYMAPEQFRGAWRDYGPWTDLYALGIMAYQMASGEYPFKGNSKAGYAQAHIVHTPRALAPRFPVPAGFESWIARLIQKSPLDRFQTAADAAWALQKLGDPDIEPVKRSTVSMMAVGFETAESEERENLLNRQTSETAQHEVANPDEAPTIFDRAPTTELLMFDDRTPSDTLSYRAVTPELDFDAPSDRVVPPTPWTWRRPLASSYTRHLLGAGLGLFGLRTVRLVGREPERDDMWDALKKVRSERTPHAVILSGDAGTGKSRLAEWLVRRADEVGSARQFRARFSPFAGPEDGITEMMRSGFRCRGANREELEERVTEVLAHHGIRNEIEVQTFVDVVFRDGHFAQTQQAQDIRAGLIANFFVHVCAERPVVVWLDDVHWNDEAIELVDHVLNNVIDDAPILFVMTVRADLVDDDRDVKDALNRVVQDRRSSVIQVDPLGDMETNSLVRELLYLEPVLAEQVTKRSGGSPLFAVQLVGDWVARGFLRFGREGFELRPGIDPSIPDDIHLLWSKRIDLLLEGTDSAERTSLEIGAALGDRVSIDEWIRACELDGLPPPQRLVRDLLSNGLGTTDTTGWSFTHGMLRESIQRSSREAGRWASVNALCVRLLEQVYPKRQPPFHERYANHLIEADAKVEALGPLLVAARRRAYLGEFNRAHRLIDRHVDICAAIDFENEDVRVAERWVLRAETLNIQGRYHEAIPYSQQAQVEARRNGWAAVRREAMLQEANSQLFAGHLALSQRLFVRARELMEHVSDKANIARCNYGIGRVAEHSGELKEALSFLSEALIGFEECGDSLGQAKCFNALGDVNRALQEYGLAHSWVEKALISYRTMGNPSGVADSVDDQAVLYRLEGQYKKALEACETALRMYEGIGAGQAMYVRMHLGWILTKLERYSEARQLLDEARVHFDGVKQVGLCAEASVLALPALARLEEWDAFDRRADAAASMLERTGWRSPELLEALEIAEAEAREGSGSHVQKLKSALGI